MATISIPRSYSNGDVLTAEQLNLSFNAIESFINGQNIGVENIQLTSISGSKISNGSITENKLANQSIITSKINNGSVTEAKLSIEARQAFIPVGVVSAHPTDTPPIGWVLCNGQQLNRITYSKLFALIDTRFGEGNGITTFNVPDIRGRFIRGVDGTAARDPDAGARLASGTNGSTGNNVGSIQDSDTQPHTHDVSRLPLGLPASDLVPLQLPPATAATIITPNPINDRYQTTLGTTGSVETRPVNISEYFIIKAL